MDKGQMPWSLLKLNAGEFLIGSCELWKKKTKKGQPICERFSCVIIARHTALLNVSASGISSFIQRNYDSCIVDTVDVIEVFFLLLHRTHQFVTRNNNVWKKGWAKTQTNATLFQWTWHFSFLMQGKNMMDSIIRTFVYVTIFIQATLVQDYLHFCAWFFFRCSSLSPSLLPLSFCNEPANEWIKNARQTCTK